MATSRLLRTSMPTQLRSSSPLANCVRYQSKAKLNNADNMVSLCGKGERKPVAAAKALTAASEHIITTQPTVRLGVSDLATLVANVGHVFHVLLGTAIKRKPWNLQPPMLIERAIIDCRFFTLFAVLGSLVGSILCFVELRCGSIVGATMLPQHFSSYVQYFRILSRRLDQGHVVQPLIEAIGMYEMKVKMPMFRWIFVSNMFVLLADMFLVGTAMFTFGVGLYVMFVGSRTAGARKDKRLRLCGCSLLGLFYMKSPPKWVGMQSIAQAMSKMGHAVMLILQAELLEKFKDIPSATGLDLACFTGAKLTSSACVFLLARLHR